MMLGDAQETAGAADPAGAVQETGCGDRARPEGRGRQSRSRTATWFQEKEQATHEVALAPWISHPHGLVSLWKMLNQFAGAFFELGRNLGALTEILRAARQPDGVAKAAGDPAVWARYCRDAAPLIAEHCVVLDLVISLDAVEDLKNLNPERPEAHEVASAVEHAEKTIASELKHRLFFWVSPERAKFYTDPRAGWDAAIARFDGSSGSNAIVTDVEEAGKCFAFERSTACVFHLMRIVEIGVQEFGSKVGFAKATETVWDTIMREIGKAIISLPTTNAVEREKKRELEGLVPYLDTVRRVWRNPVMHPKAEYTPEQASEITSAVKAYMNHLAQVI